MGYAPISTVPKRYETLSVEPTVNVIDAEQDSTVGVSCGPVGPPISGYVPGSIVIDQEIIVPEDSEMKDSQRDTKQTRHFLDDGVSDEDDIDDSTSGIFARLKNAARKYSSCGTP